MLTPPNPQRVAGAAKCFSSALEKYGDLYDVILIDTPPAVQSADALAVAARAGAALLVARNNQTAVARLQDLAGKLQNSNVTLVGSMLNGV